MNTQIKDCVNLGQIQEAMEALTVIYSQLDGIEKEQQLRIIRAVAILLDIDL